MKPEKEVFSWVKTKHIGKPGIELASLKGFWASFGHLCVANCHPWNRTGEESW